MIQNDKEYRITRYWRDAFQHSVQEITDFEQNPAESLVADGYRSMVQTLEGEMVEYLQTTGRDDESFEPWAPEESGETAVLIQQ